MILHIMLLQTVKLPSMERIYENFLTVTRKTGNDYIYGALKMRLYDFFHVL